jgi:hypothetical protein
LEPRDEVASGSRVMIRLIQGEHEMKKYFIGVVCAAVAGSLAMSVPATAQQKTEKQCREEWKAAGGKKATGKTEKDYVAGCHVTAGAKPAAPAAAPAATAPAKPATTTTKPAAPAAAPAAAAPEKPAPAATAKPPAPKSTATPAAKPTGGRAAEVARERACGKDWKAEKVAGKIPQGMTWPKYWSECDKRKKAEGM